MGAIGKINTAKLAADSNGGQRNREKYDCRRKTKELTSKHSRCKCAIGIKFYRIMEIQNWRSNLAVGRRLARLKVNAVKQIRRSNVNKGREIGEPLCGRH